MHSVRRIGPRAVLALLCVGVLGCAGRGYLARRGRDLGDTFDVGLGAGIALPYARIRATDLAVIAGGAQLALEFGVEGRHGRQFAWRARAALGFPLIYAEEGPATQFPLPIYDGLVCLCLLFPALPAAAVQRAFLGDRDPEEPAVRVVTQGPCLTTREYPWRAKPEPRSRFADRFWVGAALTCILSARLNVNPVEFVDFLVGWAGWDLLKDDAPPDEPQ